MPDNEELRKNRLIKKKDQLGDNNGEDSDEEMLELLRRQGGGFGSGRSPPSGTAFNQVDQAGDESEDSGEWLSTTSVVFVVSKFNSSTQSDFTSKILL